MFASEIVQDPFVPLVALLVGRPGLDPGTLGLKGSSRVLRGDAIINDCLCFKGLRVVA